jgi:hypothetical protein
MNREQKRTLKWVVLGAAGFLSGAVMLVIVRSLALASGTAVGIIVAIIALKHLALFLVVSSPLAALFQSIKPKLREVCGRHPNDDE